MYTHGDSNSNQRNRNPSFYPLNYGCIYVMQRYKIEITIPTSNIDFNNYSTTILTKKGYTKEKPV